MKLAPPQLPAMLDTVTLSVLDDEITLEGCKLDSNDLAGTTASSVSMDEVFLERVLLSESKLEKLNARDVIFKNCELSATNCAEASFLRTTFSDGRMTGWDCNKGLCKDVVFKNCKLNLANFRFTKLTRVRFIDCTLTDADFLGAELHEVRFEGCLLERAEFGHCKMKDVDLRTSQLIHLKGWQSLKGATIDQVQLMVAAPYLANEIGIIVAD